MAGIFGLFTCLSLTLAFVTLPLVRIKQWLLVYRVSPLSAMMKPEPLLRKLEKQAREAQRLGRHLSERGLFIGTRQRLMLPVLTVVCSVVRCLGIAPTSTTKVPPSISVSVGKMLGGGLCRSSPHYLGVWTVTVLVAPS